MEPARPRPTRTGRRAAWIALAVIGLTAPGCAGWQRADQLNTRLVETLRELFVRLSNEEQLQRLPNLLDDELPAVRRFALDRVDRRVRDGEWVPVSIQDRLVARLADERELLDLRLSAAQLLSHLN